MTHEVTRHFVTIDGRWGTRQVHYRRAGSGPAVLLLHQSPRSSREMTALMARWAQHFTLIAPDTPGYGQSDPLGPATVSIADLAEALAEFANALGLRRFGVYGYHTGASVGVWLAAAHPDRVAAMAANGLSCVTEAELADILGHYLPPVVPAWDGSHLAWLWGRMREQTIFFPWYRPEAATRMGLAVPSADALQAGLLDMLDAGDGYAVAYRAAFEARPETVVPGLRVPLLVTAGGADPLTQHLPRLRDLPPGATVERVATGPAAVERCLPHLLAHRGDPAPPAPATRPVAGRLSSRILRTAEGQVRVRLRLEGAGEPVVVVHGAGGSADTALRLVAGDGGRRPVVLPDLPGHGESDPLARTTGPGVADGAATVLAVANELGLSRVALVGEGAGACVALEAARRGGLVEPRLGLIDVPWVTEAQRSAWLAEGLPAIVPEWHGGHLLLAWHLLRDGRLFFPWFQRDPSGAVPVEPDLDPARLHLELRELLKSAGSARNLMRDVLDYPLAAALAGAADRLALGSGPGSAGQVATAAAAATGLRRVPLSASPQGWIDALLDAAR